MLTKEELPECPVATTVQLIIKQIQKLCENHRHSYFTDISVDISC